ncbi:DUF7147 family protein [Ureibacillus acetophenoni]|uniref:DUF7147 domain-containing protein n=1 Tax=Ureibacillus acetophenoni TaxID=614649 RepID=A0A285U0N8_9BACL|nr:methylthioribose kinase [Ureibacillus acetophenoni]SOC35303.1 hypothetical protein SAMN05877842_101358 [Ureibacillus acetophenoni]
MIQRFIELGQGYGDIYELCELIQTNEKRFHNAFLIISNKGDKKFASPAVAFKPVSEGKFMPIYICREGIPYDDEKHSKRIELFEQALESIGKKAIPMDVKHSSYYQETALFYNHLIGILRMNNLIPPMQ